MQWGGTVLGLDVGVGLMLELGAHRLGEPKARGLMKACVLSP
jgi:hypothetical protein